MKVVSVRHGFATNSSSSHSVVSGIPNWVGWSKEEIVENFEPSQVQETEFGWSQETYQDFATIVLYGLINFINLKYKGETLDIWRNPKTNPAEYEFAVLATDFSNELKSLLLKARDLYLEGYIDHQSEFGNNTEEEFWEYVYSTVEVETDNDNH